MKHVVLISQDFDKKSLWLCVGEICYLRSAYFHSSITCKYFLHFCNCYFQSAVSTADPADHAGGDLLYVLTSL